MQQRVGKQEEIDAGSRERVLRDDTLRGWITGSRLWVTEWEWESRFRIGILG